MLSSISIRDFRLHKRLDITFDPNVTTLIGKSYAGKSTVVRALRWVCLNKPAGTGVIRWGAKRAKVILNIDEHTITRIRSKTKNIYKLDDQVFHAFGNDVPQPIAKILNISETNFQGQHSLPFWFGETAGEVSRKLNGIVNLSIIDTTLGNLASELNKSRTTVSVSKDRLTVARADKSRLSFVDELNTDWAHVGQINSAYQKQRIETEQLDSMIVDYTLIKKIRDRVRPPTTISMENAIVQYTQIIEQMDKLDDMVGHMERLSIDVKCARQNADRLQGELDKIASRRCPLCGRNNI